MRVLDMREFKYTNHENLTEDERARSTSPDLPATTKSEDDLSMILHLALYAALQSSTAAVMPSADTPFNINTPLHPAIADQTDANYSFLCERDRATISLRSTYKFDEHSSGHKVLLTTIRSSNRIISSTDRKNIAAFVQAFARIDTVRARCFEGDILIDLTGYTLEYYDARATGKNREVRPQAFRTIKLRKAGPVEFSR